MRKRYKQSQNTVIKVGFDSSRKYLKHEFKFYLSVSKTHIPKEALLTLKL